MAKRTGVANPCWDCPLCGKTLDDYYEPYAEFLPDKGQIYWKQQIYWKHLWDGHCRAGYANWGRCPCGAELHESAFLLHLEFIGNTGAIRMHMLDALMGVKYNPWEGKECQPTP